MPTSRVTRYTRLCKPGSVAYRTGLRHAETEIGKWRAETGAAKLVEVFDRGGVSFVGAIFGGEVDMSP
jgi:hypothetical protein